MEKENKYYLVYKTTNLKNGKFYIGVHETYNLNDGYLGSGKVLRNSVYYHGKENFKREILEFCEDKKSMYQKEKEFVTEELIMNSKCMNLVVGGMGFINDEKHREVSQLGGNATSLKLKNDPEFRKRHQKIVSENMKKAHQLGKIIPPDWTGKKHKEETKRKIGIKNSIKQSGINNSQFGTCWITKNGNDKKIKKEYLQEYLSEGWIKGRYARFESDMGYKVYSISQCFGVVITYFFK